MCKNVANNVSSRSSLTGEKSTEHRHRCTEGVGREVCPNFPCHMLCAAKNHSNNKTEQLKVNYEL